MQLIQTHHMRQSLTYTMLIHAKVGGATVAPMVPHMHLGGATMAPKGVTQWHPNSKGNSKLTRRADDDVPF